MSLFVDQKTSFQDNTLDHDSTIRTNNDDTNMEENRRFTKWRTTLSIKTVRNRGRSWLLTTLVLIGSVWINFGALYAYDVPQELGSPFLNFFKLNPQSIETLYSLYSVTASPMALVGGFLTGLLTPLYTTLICTFGIYIINVGNFIAVVDHNYNLLKLLRLASGFFGETLLIGQFVIVQKWFSGIFLGFATGLVQVVNAFANVMSNFLSIGIFESYRNLSMPFFYTAVFCGVSAITAIIYAFCELKEAGVFGGGGQPQSSNRNSQVLLQNAKDSSGTLLTGQAGVQRFNAKNEESHSSGDANGHTFSLKDLCKPGGILSDLMNPFLVLIVFNNILGNQLVSMFSNMSTEFLVKRFNYKISTVKNMLSVLTLITIIFGPVYAFLAQKFGKKLIFLLVGYSLAIGGFIMLLFLPEKPSIFVDLYIFLFGQFRSIFVGCNMVCVIMISPERSLSFIIGFTLFLNNMVLVVLAQIFGMITKNNDPTSYQNATYALIALGSACLLTSIMIYCVDRSKGGFLNMEENCPEVEEWRNGINGLTPDDLSDVEE